MALKINKAPGAKVQPASPYDKHLVSTPAKGHVTIIKQKTEKNGSKTETKVMDEEEIVHPGFVLQQEKKCMLTVSGGSTINLGDYEFARIDVSLAMPTAKEELEECFEFISTWVGAKIEKAVKDAKE